MKTFRILGLLLNYPQADVYEARAEILELLHEEKLLPEKIIERIGRFLNTQAQQDILESAAAYVDTFDRSRRHSLYLFEHIHGESRDRGQAMVDLSDTYKKNGFYIKNKELPDYLPLFMEYLSLCSLKEARDLLGEAIDVIAAIGARLEQKNSPYALVFAAIESLSSVKSDHVKVKEALAGAPEDPETLEALDEAWREAEAFAGEPIAPTNCSKCTSLTRVMRHSQNSVGGRIK